MREVCTKCGWRAVPRKDGTMRLHWRWQNGAYKECPGSRQPHRRAANTTEPHGEEGSDG